MECVKTFIAEYYGDTWLARVMRWSADLSKWVTVCYVPLAEAESHAEKGFLTERVHIRSALKKARRN